MFPITIKENLIYTIEYDTDPTEEDIGQTIKMPSEDYLFRIIMSW